MKLWHWIILIVLLILIIPAFGSLLPSEAASPSQYLTTGPSEAASGSITAGACSTLTFSIARSYVIVNNRSGSTLYYVLNDTGCAASTSVYDHVLDNGEEALFDGWLRVENITVYVTPASGVRMVGW